METELKTPKRHISIEEGWANINALRALNKPIEKNKEYKLETRVVALMEVILEQKANTMTVNEMLAKYDAILM